MMNKQKTSPMLNVALWMVQFVMALSLVWAAWMKWFTPGAELSSMWPWTAQVPSELVKFTGLADLLGAMGLILPPLTALRNRLVVWAAIGVILLMICATVFHVLRGEANQTGINVVFALLAAFVAWGRSRR